MKTTKTARVSVLLTAYNREKYIASSIESVLAQRFGDFELLITDNCSTDRTLEIARAYERQDPRVRVIVNERNLGQFGNRNRAAELARAPLLKYHDSDDVMYPHCLEVMVSMIDACPDVAFGLTSGGYWPGGPCPMILTPRMSYQREFLGRGLFMCGPSGALFRSEAFRTLGPWDDFGAPSDYLFWLRACAQVNIALFPADLFWYRLHPGQEFVSARAMREYAETSRATWAALNAPGCPLSEDERDQAKRNTAFAIAKAAYWDCRARRFGLAAHRIRSSRLTFVEWARWLRRQRRTPFAGTPLLADGEFVVPRIPREERRLTGTRP